mgnify:CR=1 FL=1
MQCFFGSSYFVAALLVCKKKQSKGKLLWGAIFVAALLVCKKHYPFFCKKIHTFEMIIPTNAFQPKLRAMKESVQPHGAATIKTGGAAK